MKKIILLFILIVTATSTALPLNAQTLNASYEIESVQLYYSNNSREPQTADEIIIFASVNALQGTKIPDIWDEKSSDVLNFSNIILCRLSLNTDPEDNYNDINPVKYITDAQNDDGSYGTIEETLRASVAAQSAQKKKGNDTVYYSSKLAVNWLIGQQSENGSFNESVKYTGMAISYLSYFNSTGSVQINDAITNAARYLVTKIEQDGTFGNNIDDLCWAVMGLTDAGENVNDKKWLKLGYGLQKFKNSDGTYRTQKDGADEFNADASILAVAAYDTILNSASWVSKLMHVASYTTFTWSNIKNYIYVFGAFFVLSLTFWGFIMFGKKKHKTIKNSALLSNDSDNLSEDNADINKND